MVFQQHSLFPWKTVLGNVEFGLKMRGVGKKERKSQAHAYLSLVGLTGFEHAYPRELSGGMQQRVGIARALVNRPRVLLMDEPFGALDAQTRLTMQELLLGVWREVRTTVLFVTHDIDEALFLADRVAVMTGRPGQIRDLVEVKLARPRAAEIIATPAFTALKARVLAQVREESARTLSGPRP
jgi:NitT/TauT family transport system ATP-binding protein